MTMPPNHVDFNRGLDLFNARHFFDAHEVLEEVWRSLPRDQSSRGDLRLHIQGLVQLAVAFHHESKGNHVGARSVLERALRNLNGSDNSFPDLDLDRLRTELALWRQYFDDCVGPGSKKLDGQDVRHHFPPAFPKIMRRC